MFGSKIDLFNKEWLDVVFAKKNKSYGAYELRKENGANTTKALFMASAVFILLFLTPKIISLIKGQLPEEEIVKQVEVVVAPPPPVDPKTPPPPPVEPPPPKTDQIKFPPPIVKPDNEVRDEEPPQIEQLKAADPGQKTIEGDPGADIVIAGPVGDGPKQAAVVEDTKVYDFVSIETQPGFPGGMDKFYAYLQKTVRYPPMAQENNIQGKVFMSFVVEKDGRLTDIKVERKLGGGTDEEAIRVLKASPKWTPGIQNGKPVRVKYNIPISFTLAN
ncbi:energy transducer TonB [Pedobacter sp. MR2016-24]|uniref:energy transducer TonB n=1 Tax=Pedobacter sp. MR2016-24 TaxID=2994466 RepID=UPI002246B692|nr:energy transducer TonB [Pedobacter sp. MR2016-24]MCX2485132.1 TonB family protein [Pedobacter sp. MR2016-24]